MNKEIYYALIRIYWMLFSCVGIRHDNQQVLQ